MRFVSLAASVLLLCGWTGAAFASDKSEHPAIWKVTGKSGTAYLFGSIHILPADAKWRTGEIEGAIERSNVFVFEVPNDASTQNRMAELVAEKGSLEHGASLRAMLPPDAQRDYDADLALAHVPLTEIDGKRCAERSQGRA
jgi:uncharacterized protein YbaP (TraB family)